MTKVDKRTRKEHHSHLKKIGFQKGDERINRSGRPKGSRNKFAEEFIKDFLNDWEINGAQAIKAARTQDPVSYLRVAASLLPKDFNINMSSEAELEKMLEQFDDEHLEAIFTAISAASANAQKDPTKAKVRAKPNSLH